MGRKKLVIERIEDLKKRKITRLKREKGIKKKAYELSVLTGVSVTLQILTDGSSETYTFGGSGQVQVTDPPSVNPSSASSDDAELQAWQIDEAPLRNDAQATSMELASSPFTEELVPWRPFTLCNEETTMVTSLPDSDSLYLEASQLMALQAISVSDEWIQQSPDEFQNVLSFDFDDAEWQQYCLQYSSQGVLGYKYDGVEQQQHQFQDVE